MNYGLTAAVVLGVLALSAPKEPQHNLMKLPSFKGILEVRASIPGRMRLFVPSLAGGMEQALQVREQLLGTGVVHRVELEPRTGSMLVCYDERKVEAAVIEGAVIKLLGLDAAINGKQKSRMENGLHTILDAVDRGVMGATNGLMDGKMLAGTALSVLAIKEWRLAGLAVPGAMTLLWWAARLFRGIACEYRGRNVSASLPQAACGMRPAGTVAHALSPQRAAAQRGAALSALCSGRFDDAPRRNGCHRQRAHRHGARAL
ncbi:MAG: HMA2 domain-containing protein [Christensenellales bacterium]